MRRIHFLSKWILLSIFKKNIRLLHRNQAPATEGMQHFCM